MIFIMKVYDRYNNLNSLSLVENFDFIITEIYTSTC